MKKRIYIGLVFIWMAFIFYMSNQPANISSQHSGGMINFLSNIPYIGSIINYMMEIEIAEFIIRKLAHMFSYFVLAILIFMFMYNKSKKLEQISIQSIIFTFLYACSDEFHQLFINGRSGEFRDVMIDTIGGSIGVLILYFIIKTRHKEKGITVEY